MPDPLEDLLAFPREFLKEKERWEQLTEDRQLFLALCGAVRNPPGSWERLHVQVQKWRNDTASVNVKQRPDFVWKLDVIERLINCAAQGCLTGCADPK